MSHPDEDYVLRRLNELTQQFSQFITKEDLKAKEEKWQTANEKLKGELELTRKELKETREELKETKDELKATGEELKETKDSLGETRNHLCSTQSELSQVRKAIMGDRVALNKIRCRVLLDTARDMLAHLCGHDDWWEWKNMQQNDQTIIKSAQTRLSSPDVSQWWQAIGQDQPTLTWLIGSSPIRSRGNVAAHSLSEHDASSVAESILSLRAPKERACMTKVYRAVYNHDL